MSDAKVRAYRGGPRNDVLDLTQGSVWRGVNGKILDRHAMILVPPHDGAKGLLRVTVTGHGASGGKHIRTSPEVESFLGDYRLVYPGLAGTVTQTVASVTPSAVASIVVATLGGTVASDAASVKPVIVRHFVSNLGVNSSGDAACGLRLYQNDRWTADRNFVTGCDVCVAVATGKNIAAVATAPVATTTVKPYPTVNLDAPFESYEPGFIIRSTHDIVAEVLTGGLSAMDLYEAVKRAALPIPVMCGTVTVGHVRGLRYVPKGARNAAHILATLGLVESWHGKSFADINVFLHGTSRFNVTHVELTAKWNGMVYDLHKPTQFAPVTTVPAVTNTLTVPNMANGGQTTDAVRFMLNGLVAPKPVQPDNELDQVYAKTTAGYKDRSTDERSVIATTVKASRKTMRDLVSKLHSLPLKVLHKGASVGTVERVEYQPRDVGCIEVGMHLIEPWSTLAINGRVEIALVQTTDHNAPYYLNKVTYHVTIVESVTFISQFNVTDEGVIVVDIPEVAAKEVVASVKDTAPVATVVNPADTTLAAVGVLYDAASPNNPTPGKATFVLQSSEETLAADKAIKAKQAADAKVPVCLASDEEVARLSTLRSMRGLGSGFGKRYAGSPKEQEDYLAWVKTQLSDPDTLTAYRKEYIDFRIGGGEFKQANVDLADQMGKLLGFSQDDVDATMKLIHHKSRELSNADADVKVDLTLQQTMRLLIRTELKNCIAAQRK